MLHIKNLPVQNTRIVSGETIAKKMNFFTTLDNYTYPGITAVAYQ